MERSETIGDLIAALAKAQAEFGPATKESNNPYFGSKYADLASVISAVRPALAKHGIALMQFDASDLETQTATVITALHHGEQFISVQMEAPAVGKAKDGNPKFDVQTLGACWTYLRRYGIQAICGLASEDDDGNSLENNNKPVSKPKNSPAYASQEPGMYDEPPASPGKKKGPTEADFLMWKDAMDECGSIDDWNKLIVPMMKERYNHPQYGKQFVVACAEEAKRRGYVGDRTTGLYKTITPTITKNMPSSASIDAVDPSQEDYEAGYRKRSGK